MKRVLRWAIGVPAAILLIGFAVANRNWVDISFDPFDRDNPSIYLHLPLWGVLALGIFIGIIAGWINAWIHHRRWRRHVRVLKSENARLVDENTRLQTAHDQRNSPTSPNSPGILDSF